jgi:integrase
LTNGKRVATVATLLDWYTTDSFDRRTLRPTETCSLARLREALGTRWVHSLTAMDFVAYARARRAGEHVAASGRRLAPCAPSTLNIELSFFNLMLVFARGKGWECPPEPIMAQARACLREDETIGRSQRRQRAPDALELTRLREAVANMGDSGVPIWDLIAFAISSARPLGETLRLRWADIDPLRGFARLRYDNDMVRRSHPLATLPPAALALILRQPRRANEPRIFPFAPTTISYLFRRACREAGLHDLRYPDLRRAAIMGMLKRGCSMEELVAITAYNKTDDLRRYLRSLDNDAAAAMAARRIRVVRSQIAPQDSYTPPPSMYPIQVAPDAHRWLPSVVDPPTARSPSAPSRSTPRQADGSTAARQPESSPGYESTKQPETTE